jgi:P-type conjugative transfer protein TrbL
MARDISPKIIRLEKKHGGVLVISIAILLLLIVFCTMSNADIGNDVSGTFDAILQKFEDKVSSISDLFLKAAKYLFWTLAVIEVCWASCNLALKGELSLSSFSNLLVHETMMIGFFLMLLKAPEYFDGSRIDKIIIDSFRELASRATHVSKAITPSEVIGAGIKLSVNTMTVALASGIVETIAAAVPVLIMLVCFVLAGITLATLTIEWYLAVPAGLILLGLGGSNWTKGYAEAYVRFLVSVGLKFCVVIVVTGLTINYLKEDAMTAISGVRGGGAGFFQVLFSIVALSILMWFGVQKVPEIASGMLSGASSGSGTSLAGAALGVAAGAAAAAAGAAATAAKGAAAYSDAMRTPSGGSGGGGGGGGGGGELGSVSSAASGGSGGGSTGSGGGGGGELGSALRGEGGGGSSGSGSDLGGGGGSDGGASAGGGSADSDSSGAGSDSGGGGGSDGGASTGEGSADSGSSGASGENTSGGDGVSGGTSSENAGGASGTGAQAGQGIDDQYRAKGLNDKQIKEAHEVASGKYGGMTKAAYRAKQRFAMGSAIRVMMGLGPTGSYTPGGGGAFRGQELGYPPVSSSAQSRMNPLQQAMIATLIKGQHGENRG